MKSCFHIASSSRIFQTLASYLIKKCSMFAIDLSPPLEYRLNEGGGFCLFLDMLSVLGQCMMHRKHLIKLC